MPAASDRPRARGDEGTTRPALMTGTSSEYLGRRPLPRQVQSRAVAVILGPVGVGKSEVARRIAAMPPLGRVPTGQIIVLDAAAVHEALIDRVSRRRWADRLVEARALVLDGVTWLGGRPAALRALGELLSARAAAGRRTLVVQGEDPESIDALMSQIDPRDVAIVGLRFPKGERGRLRFARRVCEDLGISRLHARPAAAIAPWSYPAALAFLQHEREVVARAGK